MTQNNELIKQDDCSCGLCVPLIELCDCVLCRQCRDEQAVLIGLYGIDDDDLRFVNSEVQHEC